ncbi:hypothetical protein [Hymenobacter volaticus]|uniref:Outer membrane protein beta-barrel domain-containing protein n=1 Tax=Hymenobacter volaticus TaxID=2932254 RepID=A0ABY4G964_9BACT|nr:hypothetical protein [Hymenobacter volaticus]UOQ67353.1 hypothetical protein MUN86_05585 [Hymenobacter volaticus]
MKIFTTLSTLCIIAAGTPALAQTELNTRPPAGNMPAPVPGARSTMPIARPSDLSTYRTSTLGIDLGWGGPYGGLGVSYAHLVGPSTDVNVGLGVGLGGKIGVGVRHFLSSHRPLSPYLGLNLARSGRVDDFSITLNEGTASEEKATVQLASSALLHLRSGLRWQPGRVGLIGTLGYGVRLSSDPVTYFTSTGQPPSPQMRDMVNIFSPGGLELSIGMSIGLGR